MSELPKLESVSSEPSKNGNAVTEETSSESHGSDETLSVKETETNSNGASLDKNAVQEISDCTQNTDTMDEPLPEMVSETMDPEASDEKSRNDEAIDTPETDNSKDEPITIKMTEGSKGDIEESSKIDESNASKVEPALETEDSNAGDAETEKMEIETEVLPPETEELENDVEMAEENTSNDENIKITEEKNDLSREEKIENPPSEEKKESSSCEDKNENSLNEENNEMEVDEGIELDEKPTSAAKPEMEIDKDVAEESSNAAKPEVQQKEDASVESACAEKPELETVEDASSKDSMDSETLDLKPEDNAAAASKDTEKKKVLFMPIDLGIDPGPLEDFTAQEIIDYLGKKVTEYMMNPEINRLLRVQMESVQLRDQVRAKTEELNRLQAFMEKLNRDQDKFLRHFGILPKIPTAEKSVHVDWAALEPSPTANNVKEQIQKNDQLTLTPCGSSPKSNATATNAASGSSIVKKSPSSKKDGPVECIDLTDEVEAPNKAVNKSPNFKTYSAGSQAPMKSANKGHPAPLPIMPNKVNRYMKDAPPKPRVKINCDDKGIILQWDADVTDKHEKLQCFEIFGYQELKNQNITSALWKRIGNVKTLSLPMACTLTKFVAGNNYHFTVRGLDINNRPGTFSDPVSTRFDPVPKKT